MNKFDVFLNPPFEEIAQAIKPKPVDLGNNAYYAAIFNDKGVMLTIPKKATPAEAIQIFSIGLKQILEKPEKKRSALSRVVNIFAG